MKLAFKYAGRMWGIYAVLMLLSIFFVIGIGSTGWQLALGALLLVGFGVLLFNEGGYVGEKACTLGALLDRQVKEGRKIDQQQYSETWSVKNGVRALIVMVIPFLLLATVNAVVYPLYPEAPAVQEEETSDSGTGFLIEDMTEPEDVVTAPVNWVQMITRVVFSPYAALFTLIPAKVLNLLFFPFALLLPACDFAGYLCGPRLRARKLKDIARGKRRKMRKMKREREANRAPTAEV